MNRSIDFLNQFIRLFAFTVLSFLLVACNPEEGEEGTEGEEEEETEEEVVEVIEVSFSVSLVNSSVNEGDQAVITFQLSDALSTETQISAAYSGSASANDFESASSAVIPAGETSLNFPLQTVADEVYEGSESIQISFNASHSGDEELKDASQELSIDLIDLNLAPSIRIDAIKDVIGVDDAAEVLVFAEGEVENEYSISVRAVYTDGRTGLSLTLNEEVVFPNDSSEKQFSFDLSQYPVSAASKITVEVLEADEGQYRLGGHTEEVLYLIDQVSAFVAEGSPYGIAPSHASSAFTRWWLNPIRESGIDWIRGYDRRPDFVNSRLTDIDNAGYQVTGIMQWSAGDGFPDEDIDGWKAQVLATLQNADPFVKQWEIWNEPPNFSDDKDPAHYAAIVAAAYDVIKEYDDSMAVGLAASSVNVNFLDQALQHGAANHFDYITLHPYETIHLVAREGLDPYYLSIVPTVRKMLQRRNPEKLHVPIVLTEIGIPVLPGGQSVNDLPPEEKEALLEYQGIMAFKTYILSMAQDMARIHWFEPIDNETLNFGLVEGNQNSWTPRPAFHAIKNIIDYLGPDPHYIGWVLLDDDHMAYVFRNGDDYRMLTWARPGLPENTVVQLAQSKIVVNGLTAEEVTTDQLEITSIPSILLAPDQTLIEEARSNKQKPMYWFGDYSDATKVSVSTTEKNGLHVRHRDTVVDGGETVFDMSSASGVSFTVDPNFLSYDQATIRITAEVKFKGEPNDPDVSRPGFNLKYESPTGFKRDNRCWCGVPKDGEWHTITWEISDAQFVGFWGYNFSLDSDSRQYSQYLLREISVEKL